MEEAEIKKVLIDGLNLLEIPEDLKVGVALAMKSKQQMLTMIDWLMKHIKKNPTEEQVIKATQTILKKVS